MNQLEQTLSSAAANNTVPDLWSLDSGVRLREQIQAAAAGPMAPLLAIVLGNAFEADPHSTAAEYLEAFVSALNNQDSYLCQRSRN